MMLRLSNDRKVANAVTAAGNPAMANAFGLTAGLSCPGMTEACGDVCYASATEARWPAVAGLAEHNLTLLLAADYDTKVSLIDAVITDFEAKCEKRGADKLFRIHWDGDFFSVEYAKAWATVVRRHPDIRFWVYTRSFGDVNVLPEIVGIDNLEVLLSGDRDNVELAKARAAEFGVRIAMLGKTFAEAAELVGGGVRCPENNKSLPLISDKGSACALCKLCIEPRKPNVLFSATKE